MNWKVAGMASTAVVAVALTGVSATAGANKFTGEVSLSVGQTFTDEGGDFAPIEFYDDSFTSITGDAKINVAFTPNFNLQLDFTGTGSFVDNPLISLDRDAGFQGSAHAYYRTDMYAVGLFAGGGVASGPDFIIASPSAEYYFVGAEGQYYWNNFTFGLNGGYLDSSSDEILLSSQDDLYLNNAWFVRGDVTWYATPKFALTGSVGYISGDAGFNTIDVDTITWGAKAEYWPEEKEPLSLWIAYEGRDSELEFNTDVLFIDQGSAIEKTVHTIKIGVTFHFGVEEGSSQANDRQGPAWTTDDYGPVVVGG